MQERTDRSYYNVCSVHKFITYTYNIQIYAICKLYCKMNGWKIDLCEQGEINEQFS